MKDSTLRKILFGRANKLQKPEDRASTFTFLSTGEEDKHRSYTYRNDDGIILFLIKRIEKLEDCKCKVLHHKK
jgi:hypothetical protein